MHSLKTSIAKFSAFKEESFNKTLLELLKENNQLPTWSEFKAKAREAHQIQNINWLKTEYHQTVATANMAGKWQDLQATKDIYPNLKYVTIGDDRVRPLHADWDGFIAPIDHPIWSKLYPPNDWGCRCDVLATDEAVSKELEAFNPKIKQGFSNNAGRSGSVFNEIPFASLLSEAEKKAVTQRYLSFLHKSAPKELKHYVEKRIYKLPRDWQFKEVYKKGKGKVLQHLLVNKKADDYEEILDSAKRFAERGSIAEMMPIISDESILIYRKKVFVNYSKINNPDLRVDNIYMDVKRPEGIRNITGNANEAYKKQEARAVIHCGRIDITFRKIKVRAEAILNDKNKSFYPYNEVYFCYKGRILHFYKYNGELLVD